MSLDIFRNLLLQSLPNIFNIASSTLNYKVISSAANELTIALDAVDDMHVASSINQATSGDLDLHGETFGVRRIIGELDFSYRARLLASYDRPYVTKPNIKSIVTDYVTNTPVLEEWVTDRWWLGGNPNPTRVVEYLPAITDTVTQTSSGIFVSTIPDVFLASDTTFTGTNYGSGSTWTNNSSGAEITLGTPVSGAGEQLWVSYTYADSLSGDYVDWVPHGFLDYDTIIRFRSVMNNFSIVEASPLETVVQTNALNGYEVYLGYEDADKGTVYNWKTVVDETHQARINESLRIDNLVTDEFQNSDSTTLVSVNYDIARIVGVYLSTDPMHTGTNYATNNDFNGREIYLNTPLPNKTGVIVSYHRYGIIDYTQLESANYNITGDEDLRFTLEIQLSGEQFVKWGSFKYLEKRWGQLQSLTTELVGEVTDIAKAAGIKVWIIFRSPSTRYGEEDAIYGISIYGGSFY